MANMAKLMAPSTPVEVLEVLTGLLSVQSASCQAAAKKKSQIWASIPWEGLISSTSNRVPGEPEASKEVADAIDGNGCDFSSFPSLSLQKKPKTSAVCSGNSEDVSASAEALFHHHKEGVQAHVAALLARPLLVSNDPVCDDEEEEDSVDFMVDGIEKVPHLMQQNLVLSFSTLVQSRVRACATFLARHGLSRAETAYHNLDEGVSGVEHKLETLLELGRQLSLGEVETSFVPRPEEATFRQDGDDDNVFMPLSLEASITIIIPTLGGKPSRLGVKIQTTGSITGMFSKDSLLQVVQVDLDMEALISSMKEGAAGTVSKIVDETNAGYAVPLPRLGPRPAPENINQAFHVQSNKRLHLVEDDCQVITPELLPTSTSPQHPSNLDLADLEEDDDLSTLSPDKCGKIVDCLFAAIDVRVLSPPGKRARFS